MKEQDMNAKIEARIKKMLAKNPEDLDDIEEYIIDMEDSYKGDLEKFTFREAVRCGATHYVEDQAESIDLNDMEGGGYSSYLYENKNPEMQKILMRHGAFKSWDDYGNCRFACETVNDGILAYDGSFQEEVFEKYLEKHGLTREKIIQIMGDDDDEEEDSSKISRWDYEEDLGNMGVRVSGGGIDFYGMAGEEGGRAAMELVESLGWDCEFEGDDWHFNMCGVYFIK